MGRYVTVEQHANEVFLYEQNFSNHSTLHYAYHLNGASNKMTNANSILKEFIEEKEIQNIQNFNREVRKKEILFDTDTKVCYKFKYE